MRITRVKDIIVQREKDVALVWSFFAVIFFASEYSLIGSQAVRAGCIPKSCTVFLVVMSFSEQFLSSVGLGTKQLLPSVAASFS